MQITQFNAKNQFRITAENGVYFQSYDSIIVFIDNNGKVFLDSKLWNFSKTTAKYRNEFLGETTKETEKKINSGEYTLTDLNSK
jgi:hypothetical protein